MSLAAPFHIDSAHEKLKPRGVSIVSKNSTTIGTQAVYRSLQQILNSKAAAMRA